MARPRKTKSGVRIDPKTGKADTGRPTVINKTTLGKLESVFAMGGTDKEACLYAGIAEDTLYSYQKENFKFTEKKGLLKEKPLLKARQTVVEGLGYIKNAQWYLERKAKNEFSLRSELTGPDGGEQQHRVGIDDLSNLINSLPADERKKQFAALADLYHRFSEGSGADIKPKSKRRVRK